MHCLIGCESRGSYPQGFLGEDVSPEVFAYQALHEDDVNPEVFA